MHNEHWWMDLSLKVEGKGGGGSVVDVVTRPNDTVLYPLTFAVILVTYCISHTQITLSANLKYVMQ